MTNEMDVAMRIRQRLFFVLSDYKGFRHWLGDMEMEDAEEIDRAILRVILEELPKDDES